MENLSEENQISPDYVRISMAAAIELGLKPGQYRAAAATASTFSRIIPRDVMPTAPTAGWPVNVPGLRRTIPSSVLPGPSFPPIWLQKKLGNWKKAKESAGFVSPRSRIIGRTGT